MSLLIFIIGSIIVYFLFFEFMNRVKIHMIIKYILGGGGLGGLYLNIVEHGANGFTINRFNLVMSDKLYWFALIMFILYVAGLMYYLKDNRDK